MVFEIRIKLQHDCPFLDLSNHFIPRISFGYCCRSYDVLSLPGEITEELLNVAKKGFPNVDKWRISTIKKQISYIQMPCLCESLYKTSISSLIQNNGGLIKYPISYEDGWEYYNILAFDSEVQKRIIKNLEGIKDNDITVEFISIRDLGVEGLFRSQMISVPDLFEDLTSHQISILLEAFERGYYAIPRSVRTKDMAKDHEVSRYAIDKVLRSAENNLVSSVVPYLYFRLYLENSKE